MTHDKVYYRGLYEVSHVSLGVTPVHFTEFDYRS